LTHDESLPHVVIEFFSGNNSLVSSVYSSGRVARIDRHHRLSPLRCHRGDLRSAHLGSASLRL